MKSYIMKKSIKKVLSKTKLQPLKETSFKHHGK